SYRRPSRWHAPSPFLTAGSSSSSKSSPTRSPDASTAASYSPRLPDQQLDDGPEFPPRLRPDLRLVLPSSFIDNDCWTSALVKWAGPSDLDWNLLMSNPYMASSVNRRTAECGSFLSLPRRCNRTAVDRLAYGCMGLSDDGVSVELHQTLIQGSATLA